MTDPQVSELGKAISEVSEKASLLAAAISDCVVTSFAGSAPMGCPP